VKKFLFTLFFFFSISSVITAGEIHTFLNQLLNTNDRKEQEKLLEEILIEEPSHDEVTGLLRNTTYNKPENQGVILSENLCIDGVKRPFCWYIPETYDPAKKTPLLVYLHGGVSTPHIDENLEEYVENSPFLSLSENYSCILLFPFGQEGATWWDSIGVSNVLSQIRISKQNFNIDDNRVFMAGFSDGASGSFYFAMCYPTDFAAFFPLNGHPGVGSIDGGNHTYFVNLFNRPLSVINTDKDQLYPDEKIRPMMNLAIDAGANLLYRVYMGIEHSFDYGKEEIPLIQKFMVNHPRIRHPPIIKWETAEKRLGRCMWLSCDGIKEEDVADWYEDHNMELVDDRVAFGFFPDETFEGEGVKVGKVVDSTFCSFAGVTKGDIITKVGNTRVDNIQVLNDYKSGKKRGDPATVTVLRNSKEMELKGHFPPPKIYKLFRREKPSTRAEVSFSGNTFRIKCTQLGTFTIYIHPEMVQLDQNVVIYVNKQKVFDKKIEPDVEFMLRNFLQNRDRELLYVNKISINL